MTAFKAEYDLTIVGAGFGGSLLAMVAQRIGLSVLLLERGTHPRFAIGESTSPLTNLLIEEIANRYDLPRLLPLTTYGAWIRTYPEIQRGLKRGFTYYAQTAGEEFRAAADRSNQLLVAASPRNDIADTHWLRADVDDFLVREAQAVGVEYRDRVSLNAPLRQGDALWRLSGTATDAAFSVRTRLLIDATGPRGFLSRTLGLGEKSFVAYPATQALYSHFEGVKQTAEMAAFQTGGSETPPYAPDAAALHHVFDGGWMWELRFDNGVTSAGIAVTDAFAASLGIGEPGAEPDIWLRFLDHFPTIRAQFAHARAIRPFVHVPRLAYRAAAAAGEGWALLPSSAAFIDPLFSTGFPLTLLGIERMGRILEETSGKPAELEQRLDQYGAQTLGEADATADFIGGCYAVMGEFSAFAALSMFYFAAASYSEMARRIGKPERTAGFLMAEHPEFGSGMHRCAEEARCRCNRWTAASVKAFADEVAERIACLNVAGLGDTAQRNWYPVELRDVIAGAEKLGITPTEMERILCDAPWV